MTTSGTARPEGGDRVGSTLGSYVITGVLGEGSMGVVYAARHRTLGREVALKRLRDRYAGRQEAVARFIDEARAVNRIGHPDIVSIIDLVSGGSDVYCIMELLRGETLSRILEDRGAFVPEAALRLARRAADALAATHDHGIVHRDVKPSNLFLVSMPVDGSSAEPGDAPGVRLKVLDFGIAQMQAHPIRTDEAERGDGSTQSSLLTPAYMSPEQAEGRDVDATSDVYSLGAVIFELLTGAPPFRASSFVEYVYRHTSEAPPRLSEAGPFRFHQDLESLVARCLAKDQGARFKNAGALRDALDNLLARPETLRRRARTRPLSLLLGGAAMALGLILVALAFWGRGVCPAYQPSFGGDLGPGGVPWPQRRDHGAGAGTGADAGAGTSADAGAGTGADAGAGTSADAGDPHEILLRIVTAPAGAEVHRLSPRPSPLGLTPLTLRVPRETHEWRLQVRLMGHEERELTLVPDRSQEHHLALPGGMANSAPARPLPALFPESVMSREPAPRRPPPHPENARDVINPFGP